MPTAPPQAINTHQKIRVHVNAFNFDAAPDPTSTLGVSTTNATVATAVVASDDPRAIDITAGDIVASCNVLVTEPGALAPGTLTIPVNVSAAPNLARVDYVSSDPPTLK